MPALARFGATPVATDLILVLSSVSTSTSAMTTAAGAGPFRGFWIKTSTSFSFTTFNGVQVDVDNAAKNSFIWIQAAFVHVIATATSLYGAI